VGLPAADHDAAAVSVIGARPPEYDERQWQRLRRDGRAATGGMLGLLAVLAASVGWMLILIPPGNGQIVRLNPLAWLAALPGAILIGAGLLSYRPRAMRMLRWALVAAPLASVAAALVGGAPAARAGDMSSVLRWLAAVTVVAAAGSALALRFSALASGEPLPGSTRRAAAAHTDPGPHRASAGTVPVDRAGRLAVQSAAFVVICGVIGVGFAAIPAFGPAGLAGMLALAALGIGWTFRLAARARQSPRALAATLTAVPAALTAITIACLVWLAAAPSPVARVAAVALAADTAIAITASVLGRHGLRRSTSFVRRSAAS